MLTEFSMNMHGEIACGCFGQFFWSIANEGHAPKNKKKERGQCCTHYANLGMKHEQA